MNEEQARYISQVLGGTAFQRQLTDNSSLFVAGGDWIVFLSGEGAKCFILSDHDMVEYESMDAAEARHPEYRIEWRREPQPVEA
jgi:hypothetical protein